MTEIELEKIIRKTLYTSTTPDRVSFSNVLSQLPGIPVTKNNEMRYNKKTTTSNIINNTITEIIGIWKSKRIILVPSFVLLIFIGAFSLSPKNRSNSQNSAIIHLAEQSELIEEPGIDTDDEIILTSFDEPAINDLSTINNEL